MNYSRIGQKYGIAFKDEVVNSIQARLEKRVSAFISRQSKKTSLIEAKMFILQSNKSMDNSTIHGFGDEYDKIIDARAVSNRRKSAMIRQKAIAEAMEAYKSYSVSLEAYVKKAERRSDWQYRQFLLGAARHSNLHRTSELAHFKSQVYTDYKEKKEREMNNYGG